MKLEIKFSEETSYKWYADLNTSRKLVELVEEYMNAKIRHMGFATYESLMNELGVRTDLQHLTCGWLSGDAIKIDIKEHDRYLILETNCRKDIRNS